MSDGCDTTANERNMAQSSAATLEATAEQSTAPPPLPPKPKTKSKSCGNSPKCSSREHSRPHSPAASWKKPSGSGSPVAEMEREGAEEAPFGRESGATSAYSSPYSERATPPYLRWAKSLEDVLDDYEGMELFKQYLASAELKESHLLDFWYACKGLRQLDGTESEKIRKVAERLYADYIATRGVHYLSFLSRETRAAIHSRLISSDNIDQSMYDEAHKEVQVYLRSRHASFVSSEVYIFYLQDIQAGGWDSPKCYSGQEVHSNNSSSSGEARRPSSTLLPTVHEDTEFESESERLAAMPMESAAPISATTPKIFTTSEVENSGSVLWSNQAAEAAKPFSQQQDILNQAISAASSGLSNVEGAAASNTGPKRRAASIISFASQHSRSTGSPLTRDTLNASFGQRLLSTKPISARCGVPINPYHAPYTPYLPTSAQDSELQSMSSDATTESGFSGANYQRKEHRIMQHHIEHNRDLSSNQNMIPRTERSRGMQQQPQDMTNEDFRRQVREKLEEIRRDQVKNEKLDESMKRLSEPENGHNDHRAVANKFYTEINSMKNRKCNDEPDAILEDHCSRVPYFKDSPKQSPLRSPGFAAVGRRRSPMAKSPIRAMTTSYPSAGQPQLASFSNPNARMVVDPAVLMSQSVIQPTRSKSGHHSAGNTIHRVPKHEQFMPVPTGSAPPIDKRITGAVAKRPAARYPPAASDTSGVYSGTSTEPSLVSARFTPNLPQRNNEQHWMSDSDAAPAQTMRMRMRGASTNNAAPPLMNAASESKSHRSSSHRNAEKSLTVEKSRNQKTGSDSSAGGQVHRNLPTYPRRSDQGSIPPPFCPNAGAPVQEITVGIFIGNEMPYLVRYPGRQITLKQFKQLIPKKGNYRFFFQCFSDELGTGTVQREVMEDHEILPFFEYNKIVAKVINNE